MVNFYKSNGLTEYEDEILNSILYFDEKSGVVWKPSVDDKQKGRIIRHIFMRAIIEDKTQELNDLIKAFKEDMESE